MSPFQNRFTAENAEFAEKNTKIAYRCAAHILMSNELLHPVHAQVELVM
jgi:hypothetical protein